MHKLSVTLLVLAVACQAAHLTPQERLLALPEGSFIEVRLKDKSRFHGRLDKLEAGSFLITAPTANHLDLVQRRIAFGELKAVRSEEHRHSGNGPSKKAIAWLTLLAFVIGPLLFAISGDR